MLCKTPTSSPSQPLTLQQSSHQPTTQQRIQQFQSLQKTLMLPFITAYGLKLKTPIIFEPGTGRTKQSFKDECDINQIMSRYQKTGVLDFVAKHAPQYGDSTGVDFRQGLDTVIRARQMFEDLPSSIRAKFQNDPGAFLDFCSDPANRSEMAEMGLLKPEPEVAPPQPGPTPDAATAPVKAPKGPKKGPGGSEASADDKT